MTTAFTWVWACPLPSSARALAVAANETNSITVDKQAPAVILYPSLMTPCVYRRDDDDPWLELLLATSEPALNAKQVNRQLKVYPGLDAVKKYHVKTLFEAPHSKIVVEATKADGQGILRTHKHFAGVVHELVLKRLESKGLTHFYRVRVHRLALAMAETASAILQAAHPLDPENKTWPVELGDSLIADVLKERHKFEGYKELPNHGWFAFNLGEGGVQLWDEPAQAGEAKKAVNSKEPIQSYHPVCLLDESAPAHLNFGHLTDIHLNSRLDILQQNPVQVLPYKDPDDAKAAGSLPIGEIIQPSNRSFSRLLGAMAGDRDAHALLIGGDLIDHQLNAYTNLKPPAEMGQVWDTVDLDRLHQKDHYAPGIDMVAFYSLLIDFCRSSSKPVFGVNGNHDCYVKPFGISPRAFGNRANEGIPADVNLTFYEAALAFGPSWADCEVPVLKLAEGKPPSSFEAEWMEWFYAVFTPFTEFSVQLPKQQLVCLGWGDNEDMMLGGQGFPGHLPRADSSVSDVQLSLLREATGKAAQRRVIVLSHFTIASFHESVPLFDPHKHEPSKGWLAGDNGENAFNMGTFEKHRNELLDLLTKRSITCVLSGHSHRRGLYFLGDMELSPLGPMPVQRNLAVTIHDPEGYMIPEDQPLPAIVVSDCGGPYPRHNRYGEFKGWGSDRPSGSVVVFADTGRPREVKVVRATTSAAPRIAVAVDYLDIVAAGGQPALELRTKSFRTSDEAEMPLAAAGGAEPFSYILSARLHRNLVDAKLRVRSIVLHAPTSSLAPLPLHVGSNVTGDGHVEIRLTVTECLAFFRWINEGLESDRFVAVAFDWSANASVSRLYSLKQPWIFEVIVKTIEDGYGHAHYVIERPWRTVGGEKEEDGSGWQEVPDFSWRRFGPGKHTVRELDGGVPPGGMPSF